MKVIDYSDFTQNISKAFNTALVDEVIINSKNGYNYRLLPINNNDAEGKSPLEDIPCIRADITTQGIVEILRECRAGI
jgi:hypothetical protein